ncbi:GNAT family N-acetyltransferase [Teichococcus oryzae]|uniref:GNAT family N-acetyltransferase n=1 Tax=Teichococcus oryzae TaxID=1608942 RepID=A0A5B2TBA5_9PROT|nr:GNAT family N-acetyltransferase [Pseudoroseomonas oryzae]KAA2211782.1 GNAT family N-acetyltransferase [Pseudoroseomonas oryzae]
MAPPSDPSPRLARPDEAPALAALVRRAYAPWVPVIGRPPAPMQDDYAARIAAGQAWVLEEDGVLLGLVVIEEHPACLWLDNVAVDPARHGAGIGRALLRFVGREARRRGLPEIGLITNEKMASNIALYRRLGFTERGRRLEKGFHRVEFRIAAGQLLAGSPG